MFITIISCRKSFSDFIRKNVIAVVFLPETKTGLQTLLLLTFVKIVVDVKMTYILICYGNLIICTKTTSVPQKYYY